MLFLINKKFHQHQIINICSSEPISLLKILSFFKGYSIKLKKIKRNKLDVMNTHGDNKRLKKLLKKIKFTDKKKAILNTFDWYKKNRINKFI
jgi:nucleoside-diphosphate-sugar epimerase